MRAAREVRGVFLPMRVCSIFGVLENSVLPWADTDHMQR